MTRTIKFQRKILLIISTVSVTNHLFCDSSSLQRSSRDILRDSESQIALEDGSARARGGSVASAPAFGVDHQVVVGGLRHLDEASLLAAEHVEVAGVHVKPHRAQPHFVVGEFVVQKLVARDVLKLLQRVDLCERRTGDWGQGRGCR